MPPHKRSIPDVALSEVCHSSTCCCWEVSCKSECHVHGELESYPSPQDHSIGTCYGNVQLLVEHCPPARGQISSYVAFEHALSL